jgi:hypothetical protein
LIGNKAVIKSLLRLTMIGTTITVLLIGGLRLLPGSPPDTSAVASLFQVTEACPTGCMLGIPPETTRLRDAVDSLEAHAWVGGVSGSWENELFTNEVTVRWRWSGMQPDFIDSSVPGIMIAESFGYDGVPGHIVTSMTITTNLRLYDLYQMMGPTSDGVARYDPSRHALIYGVSYHDPEAFTRTSLMASLPCPAGLMTYWHAAAMLEYRGGMMLTPYVPPEQLTGLCLGE